MRMWLVASSQRHRMRPKRFLQDCQLELVSLAVCCLLRFLRSAMELASPSLQIKDNNKKSFFFLQYINLLAFSKSLQNLWIDLIVKLLHSALFEVWIHKMILCSLQLNHLVGKSLFMLVKLQELANIYHARSRDNRVGVGFDNRILIPLQKWVFLLQQNKVLQFVSV